MQFISDASLNGAPITIQIDLSQNILNDFPDTLSKLAINQYNSYQNHFPRAIADNFEEGTSREIIYYPKKLIFRFELFENEYYGKPYLTKDITVRRNNNGELNIE